MAKRKEEKKDIAIPALEVSTDGTDGKVTMIKDGKGKRFHKDRIDEMKEQGWALP